MRVPPELDGLMWAIAEENSDNATEEFVARYPIYRDELMRRQAAVASLRLGKPRAVPSATPGATRPIPAFTPRRVKPLAPEPGQIAFASILALAGLAAASFVISTMVFRPAPTPPPPIPPVRTGPLRVEVPPVVRKAPPPPVLEAPRSPDTVVKPPPTPKSERPQSLVVKGAPLRNVLDLLGVQSGLVIVLAPGMPDPDVEVDYHDWTPMEILRDLGRQYRFTAFDQGDGSIVVYPAVDARANPARPTAPTSRIGG